MLQFPVIPGLHPSLLEALASPSRLTGREVMVGGESCIIAEIYSTARQVSEATELMAASFASDCYYGERPARGIWLEDITDFRHVLCIGHFSDNSPICLDTRDAAVPVIAWDGFGWVRIAQSAEQFADALGAG